uniref:NADH:flavin oxidoreductase/NADH oxidase N-terminal domain-containing protein n=1 Tax=Globisporangium ultimum (strain ATCC 200006 / CBS 805.95 / DAOM BR144) TaxID=431595 RepID=K3XDD4_GLOUD
MTAVTKDYKLFTPLQVGEGLTLKNRVVYGPLTRARSDVHTRVPNELNAVYYEQRAGAGLIISEATAISEQAFGWYGAPALYNDEQAEGWRKVVKRVHARDGKIFLQLWHMGRQTHPSLNSKGEVVSASATCYEAPHAKQQGRERA